MGLGAQRREKRSHFLYCACQQASFGELTQYVESIRVREVTIAKHGGGGASEGYYSFIDTFNFAMYLIVMNPSGGTVCT